MAQEIHVNDIGTVFRATILNESGVVVDLSSATLMQFTFKNNKISSFDRTCSFTTDGSDGKIEYTTVDGDLSVEGQWDMQANFTIPTGSWHTDLHPFQVVGNL